MRKVEIFTDSSVIVVRDSINSWFRNHPNAIVEDRLQTEATNSEGEVWLTISIFYNEVSENAKND